MRLLNARTLQLESFFADIPSYAILSHVWEDDEVLLSDLANIPAAKLRKGFKKIEKTCEQALNDNCDYCWIDTCCIDKTSSAELSEAINSMFEWYKQSHICYAYLADVVTVEQFEKSRWFKRAWTLQELLAPSRNKLYGRSLVTPGLVFFANDWTSLGDKSALGTTIARITGVAREYLEGEDLGMASISMRMSWAAGRQATRAEDIAYSLLGIFDVNMPLLYGEGKMKAFRRLQEEIMKTTEDGTYFLCGNT
jgi:hypothetical protein